MPELVPLILFGWLPLVLVLFAVLPGRRAVIWAAIAGCLFLPNAGYGIAGLPAYTKTSATHLSILLGTLIFDSGRILRFRPHWCDIPIVVFCVCPLVTGALMGPNLYTGGQLTMQQCVEWGLPFLIGRIYFRSLEDVRELAIGVVVGALLYVPLCLYEMKMSPSLHGIVYGLQSLSWGEVRRGGGWRPMVFLRHGLMLGVWMAAGSTIAFSLWRSRAVSRVLGIWPGLAAGLLIVVTLLCRSTGASVLMLAAIAVIWLSVRQRLRWLALLLVLFPVMWTGFRSSRIWSGQRMLKMASMISPEREGSLWVRISNEDAFAAKALQRPIFGWGHNNDFRPDAEGLHHQKAITDGMWVIWFGRFGFVGLGSWMLAMAIPPWRLLRAFPAAVWLHPRVAAAVALSVVVGIYQIDCLFNGFPQPVFVLAAGAILSLTVVRSAAPIASKTTTRRELQASAMVPAKPVVIANRGF